MVFLHEDLHPVFKRAGFHIETLRASFSGERREYEQGKAELYCLNESLHGFPRRFKQIILTGSSESGQLRNILADPSAPIKPP
jgi:hypothetical protein